MNSTAVANSNGRMEGLVHQDENEQLALCGPRNRIMHLFDGGEQHRHFHIVTHLMLATVKFIPAAMDWLHS